MFLKIIVSVLVPCFLFAQVTLLERSYTFESDKESMSEAKKEIQDKAIDQIVEELATETMGEVRFAKAKKSLSVQLANKSARFIPFSNITDSKQTDKVLKQTLMFKINLAEFRNVLKSIGQLEEIDKNQSILPLVRYENAILQKNSSWWNKDDDISKSLSVMEEKLGEIFLRGGFYLTPANQVGLTTALPTSFNKSHLNAEDTLKLARLLQTPYVLSGLVLIKRSERQMDQMRMEVHLNLVQAENGKMLADIKRIYDMPLTKDSTKLDAEISKKMSDEAESIGGEIVSLMTDALQRGLVNSQKIRIKFTMASQPQKIELLKERVKAQSGNIKNVKEKSISANSIVYEVDFVGNIKDIQDKLLAMDVKSLSYLKVELTNTAPEEISFELKQ
ncbi:MAG: hypothetical protein B7Y39_10625 [Bdellovibrio sp. 28-41-41]|nr:MAG: hypothetical protein B7Y39_10625 [Bdellovibrio sp. 28-41-41]